MSKMSSKFQNETELPCINRHRQCLQFTLQHLEVYQIASKAYT